MKKAAKTKLKLLVVAMAESTHTAKWINQITDEGWDIHLFSYEHHGLAHPLLRNITIHYSIYGKQKNRQKDVRFKGLYVFSSFIAKVGGRALREFFKGLRSRQLSRLIRKFKPDVIHSMETQKCGYLTSAAKEIIKGSFPAWIHSNWGSDLYLFGRLQKHEPRIKKVLENCGYFICECDRDVVLAGQHGYKGEVLPVCLHAGGFNIDLVSSLRHPGKTSDRRYIMIKGQQGWSGRGLVGLRALERCADVLSGYVILLYMVYSEDVLIKAELITKETGIPITPVEQGISDEDMLRLFGKSRISIGLGISDGVPTTMLEAIVMGAFPIQSLTSCAEDWIIDGKTGILVPPEDPEVVEKAIRRALTDDDLVNRAAEMNYKLSAERLDEKKIRPKVVAMYRQIFDEIDR